MGLSNKGNKQTNPTYFGEECAFISKQINENAQVEKWSLDSCGEYNAVNNAIMDGAQIQNLYLYSVTRRNGDYMAACKNCRLLYEDYVHFIGDDSQTTIYSLAPMQFYSGNIQAAA
ncbi:MAG: hypothetical protein IJN43_00360 [Ruminococcus sp.]|nr:hypothetical protein [Ruminococcus sp.]